MHSAYQNILDVGTFDVRDIRVSTCWQGCKGAVTGFCETQ